MGTAGPHLWPLKSTTGDKAALHDPQRIGDQPQHPVPKIDEEEKKEGPSAEAVWTFCSGIQKIN